MASSEPKHIVIVGGGIIGCTSAYFLSRHPSFDPSKHSITLLEASTLAGGASGKAGGLLALWAYPKSLVPLSYRLHRQLADEHGGAERWGYRAVHCGQVDCVGQAVPAAGAQAKVDGKNGAMTGENDISSTNGKERVSLQKRSTDALARLQAAGVPDDLDWVHPEALRAYEAMGDPTTTAQVHPYQFTTAMAQLAREKGVRVHEHARVSSINYSADNTAVESVTYTSSSSSGESTTIPATDVVIAAGPWTRALLPSAPISALRAHSVTIRPSSPVSAYALFTSIRLPPSFPRNPSHAGATVTPEIYARPRNEVYACGEGDTLVPLPALSSEVEVDEQRCQDIVDFVASISPPLRDGEVTARQACYLPNVDSGNGSPLIGFTGVKGVVLAAGHTCWGIQNGPATGKIVSEMVFDGKAKSARVEGLDPRKYLD